MIELEVSTGGFLHLEESWLCPDFQKAEFFMEGKGKKLQKLFLVLSISSAQRVHKQRDVVLYHPTSASFPHLHSG